MTNFLSRPGIDRCGIAAAAILACMLQFSLAAGEATAPPAAAARPDAKPLILVGEDGQQHAITDSELAKLPRQKVRVRLHEQEAEFEGVSLADLLERNGVKLGDGLKGRRAATVALLEATDGYRVVLTLVDLDPASSDRVAVLADRRDGKQLTADEAPYRLIVPGDKRPIRWIRMVKSIRVLNLNDALPLTRDVDAAAALRK